MENCKYYTNIPKAKPVQSVNNYLRPSSLTSIVSKIGKGYVYNSFVNPVVLKKLDRRQCGTVPSPSTISMLHFLNASTDGNGATTKIVRFDYKKVFNLIDHRLLLKKLATYDPPMDS